jgi:hypothetical protein
MSISRPQEAAALTAAGYLMNAELGISEWASSRFGAAAAGYFK